MPSRNHALVSRSSPRRSRRPAWRLRPVTQALAVLLVAGDVAVIDDDQAIDQFQQGGAVRHQQDGLVGAG
ncbi:hypothetical protein, partial [Achromobacter xylosoxidans]|uniref:hypothetical protein n=1 Tax=Alcaligenes xylosoxydans xylosoxydans TaxID=85698 RepID=UPI003D01C1F8